MNNPARYPTMESVYCVVVVLFCVAVGGKLLNAAWSSLIDWPRR